VDFTIESNAARGLAAKASAMGWNRQSFASLAQGANAGAGER